MSVGIALLVTRRLALMRDHWAALRPPLGKMGEIAGAVGNRSDSGGMSLSASQGAGNDSSAAPSAAVHGKTLPAETTAVVGGGAARDRVMESGIFLLGLEVSAMVWLVGGWSSLVALRFRCSWFFIICFCLGKGVVFWGKMDLKGMCVLGRFWPTHPALLKQTLDLSRMEGLLVSATFSPHSTQPHARTVGGRRA